MTKLLYEHKLGTAVLSVLAAVNADAWVFFSGVAAGLGANVFATRALTPGAHVPGARMVGELVVFLGAGALGLGAGEFRRRAEEHWRNAGAKTETRLKYVDGQFRGLCFFACASLLYLLSGLWLISH